MGCPRNLLWHGQNSSPLRSHIPLHRDLPPWRRRSHPRPHRSNFHPWNTRKAHIPEARRTLHRHGVSNIPPYWAQHSCKPHRRSLEPARRSFHPHDAAAIGVYRADTGFTSVISTSRSEMFIAAGSIGCRAFTCADAFTPCQVSTSRRPGAITALRSQVADTGFTDIRRTSIAGLSLQQSASLHWHCSSQN